MMNVLELQAFGHKPNGCHPHLTYCLLQDTNAIMDDNCNKV
jgi:hypothetical protein